MTSLARFSHTIPFVMPGQQSHSTLMYELMHAHHCYSILKDEMGLHMSPLHGVDLGWRLGNKTFHGSTQTLHDMEKNRLIQVINLVASSLYVGLSHDIGDTQAGYTQSGLHKSRYRRYTGRLHAATES